MLVVLATLLSPLVAAGCLAAVDAAMTSRKNRRDLVGDSDVDSDDGLIGAVEDLDDRVEDLADDVEDHRDALRDSDEVQL